MLELPRARGPRRPTARGATGALDRFRRHRSMHSSPRRHLQCLLRFLLSGRDGAVRSLSPLAPRWTTPSRLLPLPQAWKEREQEPASRTEEESEVAPCCLSDRHCRRRRRRRLLRRPLLPLLLLLLPRPTTSPCRPAPWASPSWERAGRCSGARRSSTASAGRSTVRARESSDFFDSFSSSFSSSSSSASSRPVSLR